MGCSSWGCKESGPTERLTLAVLHTVLYNKIHKSTPTCLGCVHDNMRQICELTDVIAHANELFMLESFQFEGLFVTDLLFRC